ncbi:MAG: hypothetical protein AAF151_24620 [Cyanobacteria bacterium J06656_5]
MPQLNTVSALPQSSFKAWISNSKFKISSPISSKKFILDVYSYDELLAALAFDINRMATSGFESIKGIIPEKDFPKSIGWLVIAVSNLLRYSSSNE